MRRFAIVSTCQGLISDPRWTEDGQSGPNEGRTGWKTASSEIPAEPGRGKKSASLSSLDIILGRIRACHTGSEQASHIGLLLARRGRCRGHDCWLIERRKTL